MMTSSFVRTDIREGVAHAIFLQEKVGEREAPIIIDEVCAEAPKADWRVVLDLTEVGLLASAGLGAVLTIHKRAVGNGGNLAVHGVSPEIHEMLKLTRLHKLFTIADSEKKAVKAVSK